MAKRPGINWSGKKPSKENQGMRALLAMGWDCESKGGASTEQFKAQRGGLETQWHSSWDRAYDEAIMILAKQNEEK